MTLPLSQDLPAFLIAKFLLVELHLPLYIPIEHHMLQEEFILSKDALLEVWELLLVLLLEGVEFVHEPEAFEVEGGGLLVVLQEDLLLVLEELVLDDVLLEQAVERLHVLAGQGDLEVGLVTLRLLLPQGLPQAVQVSHIPIQESLVLEGPQQLHPLLDVLGVDQTVLLQDLLHLRDAQDLLLQGRELRLRTVLQQRRDGGLPLGSLRRDSCAVREVYHPSSNYYCDGTDGLHGVMGYYHRMFHHIHIIHTSFIHPSITTYLLPLPLPSSLPLPQ